MSVPHLLTLADLSLPQLTRVLAHSAHLKALSLPLLRPLPSSSAPSPSPFPPSLQHKTIALLFSKRSTRTRLSAESATHLLGGHPMFLSSTDIQLGVNESLEDSARVIGGLVDGVFARVGGHEEVETLAKFSPVPVLNALSDLWHPTQILADILTLLEHLPSPSPPPTSPSAAPTDISLLPLQNLTLAWLGDSTNVLHDMLVTYPRLGSHLRVAVPKKYPCPPEVWDRVLELGCEKGIVWTDDPREAVHGADVVVTDTWISMGQESQKSQRLTDFSGFQITESLCLSGGAKPDWKFLHCLPRKKEEVDDEVFYGRRSLVWEEAGNRKWTIMALFDLLFGKWQI